MSLFFRQFVAVFMLCISPGFGTCYRCHQPWSFAKEHTTYFVPNKGMFPLCEKCWAELTPAQRLPYYRKLWGLWHSDGRQYKQYEWENIKKAVEAGQ